MFNSKTLKRLAIVMGMIILALGAFATMGVFAAGETADAATAAAGGLTTGIKAIAAAIAAILAKTGIIESSKFAEAQAGLDMLINKIKTKFA